MGRRTGTMCALDECHRSICTECFTMTCLAFSRLLKRCGWTLSHLLFGHEPERFEGESLGVDNDGLGCFDDRLFLPRECLSRAGHSSWPRVCQHSRRAHQNTAAVGVRTFGAVSQFECPPKHPLQCSNRLNPHQLICQVL